MVTTSQRYRDKVSQMISWGHWFALFNILLSLGLGSRYFFIADWPSSLAGRLYAFASWLGHFSFLGFTLYLLVMFPLTFVVMSQRLLRFLSAIITTAALTLLLVDTEVFTRFHQHLNSMVWDLLINPDQTELVRDWQLMFIGIPLIFLVEVLFVTWSWQKLRSLNRYRIGKPISTLFIVAFCASHIAYIWADANFYRPITMQRANLPLSYPMTARRFLKHHGLINTQDFDQRLVQQGNQEAAVEYPLNPISFNDKGSGLNLLIITTSMLSNDTIDQQMPVLKRFAQKNICFTQHFSTGNQVDTGLFGLFYGISASYLDGILATRKSSVLLDALNKQGYQLSLFPSDGFHDPLYRQALLADFTLPEPVNQSDAQTARQWQQWRNSYSGTSPWFSYVSFNGTRVSISLENTPDITRHYQQGAQRLDNSLAQMLNTLREHGDLDNTVVIITAATGLELDDDGHVRSESSTRFNRAQLQVPLVVHWPGAAAQVVTKLTNHNDVTVTLMQHLLHISNHANDYAQGEDLFASRRRNDWVLSANRHQLAITTLNETLLLDNNGSCLIFDVNGKELPQKKPQLTLLLQVLTNEKRFIAN
ncbi:membrane protein [Sodalis-like endosymbiont of Proechinophthirus fluctus]|uniref:LPS biosynthesis-modulating metalloenzyme YejM n=1 Tax=Sodalis-like endosymbiont of Proechinophthirus fluctus TaxID=1462730 RepID=UPI0007A881D9|nr:LPS biosynthesis-modulating metalloenzyme YejM [Sodalis-like endosymbiont of Proechinophthirus fluctus]KYP95452.1 membrane protein [Sodalis-like endosymbiont of Proechinophthirus fluctus]